LGNSIPEASIPVNSLTGVRGFIFDIDGTLYDSSHIHRRLFLARPLDVRLLLADRKTRKSLMGADYGDAETYYREFFSVLAHTARKSERFVRAWYFDAFMPRICRVLKKHYCPRPGCIALLETLTRTGIRFAIYSDYPLAADRLRALDIHVKDTMIYSPDTFGAQKPAARPFLAIAEDLGIAPGEILVVGDRDDTDGAGAAAAGMGFVRVKTGGEWEAFCAQLRK
jgi:FMN phosphatase YigB (HAD superfamily)